MPRIESKTLQKIFCCALGALATVGLAAAQTSGTSPRALVLTNADLERLPQPGNDSLPVLDEPAAAPAADVETSPAAVPATSPPPASAAGVDAKTIEWLQGRLEQLRVEQALAVARRHLDDATQELTRLQRTLRSDGSAFPDSVSSTDVRYVRGVADRTNEHGRALQRAYDERDAAQREVDRLLAKPKPSGS